MPLFVKTGPVNLEERCDVFLILHLQRQDRSVELNIRSNDNTTQLEQVRVQGQKGAVYWVNTGSESVTRHMSACLCGVVAVGVLVRAEAKSLDDLVSEGRSGGRSSEVRSSEESLLVDVSDCLFDVLGVLSEAHISEHHGSGENGNSGVGYVLSTNVEAYVACTRLEDGDVLSEVGARDDSRSTDESASDIGNNVSVQVGCDEDVELARVGDELHASVIDDHLSKLDLGILLSDGSDNVQEETVGHLHDVSLVNSVHLLAAVCLGVLEGEARDLLALLGSCDFEGLDDARNGLVLQA